MGLTVGADPFGPSRTGRFDFPAPAEVVYTRRISSGGQDPCRPTPSRVISANGPRAPTTRPGKDNRSVEVNGAPRVLQLDHPSATDPSLAGSKAAALAVAAQRGMPTLGGAVLTTAFSSDVDRGADLATHPALREVFDLSFAVLGAAQAVRATGADESALDPAYRK